MKTINFVLLLDESGSMRAQAQNAIDGTNKVIDTLKRLKALTGNAITLSLFTMTHKLKTIFTVRDIDHVEHIGARDFAPDGGNEIRCCIYETVAFMDTVSDKGTQTVFITFTDGEECYGNPAYTVTSREEVGHLLREAMKRKNWTFAYIAPTSYRCKEFATQECGYDPSNVTIYQTDSAGTRGVFNRMAFACENYFERDGDLCKNFFSSIDEQTTMDVNGYKCVVNTPTAIKSKKEASGLPPYHPTRCYKVDEYPGCPSHWMHGSAKASSYFISVDSSQGMWFDLNENDSNPYDVAAVISVQGVNPVTGQKVDSLRLEQYKTKCPVHDVEFQQDRFCPNCKFKWPAQNYLSTTSATRGQFWLDGFRSEDGKVRQYVFTEEEARGVAASVIGDDRVFAIGIAFYRSKAKRKVVLTGFSGPSGPHGSSGFSGCIGVSGYVRRSLRSFGSTSAFSAEVTSASLDTYALNSVKASGRYSEPVVGTADLGAANLLSTEDVVTSYEVAAGCVIDQSVNADAESVDFWCEEPVGMIYINYAPRALVKQILAAGKREEVKEGFLSAIPVGN